MPRHRANFEGLGFKVWRWLAGRRASPAGFCFQRIGVPPPANTMPKRFQTKGLGCFAKLPQRLNQSFKMFLFFIFMKKHTESNTLENSQ